jgi:TPR repeat protein
VKQYCVLEDQISQGKTSWSHLTREESEQLAETVALWRESANRGVIESWFNLGLMFWYGRGTNQHLPSALSCFFKAAE